MNVKFSKFFKWNEITSFFEHAKSMGLQPTLVIKTYNVGEKFAWISVQIRDTALMSRMYDEKWLKSRVKSYIEFNKKCPYGEVRIIEE